MPLTWPSYNQIKDFSNLHIDNVMFIHIVKLEYHKHNLVLYSLWLNLNSGFDIVLTS